MKTKNIFLISASIFIFVFSLVFTSAVLSFDQVSLTGSIEAGQSSKTIAFNLYTTQNYTNLTWASNIPINVGSLSYPTNDTILLSESPKQFSITINNIPHDFIGTITSDLNITDIETNDSATIPIAIQVVSPTHYFCEQGSNSSDLVLSVDIKNKGEGDDDKWLSLDNIEVKVDFENNRDSGGQGLYDLDDLTFEITLQKTNDNSQNLLENMQWISEDDYKYTYGDVDEGDDADHTFKFRIDPSEIEEGDYILMVKAYPKDDESQDCIDYSENIFNDFMDSAYWANVKFKLEGKTSKMVVVDVDSLDTLNAQCEQSVSFSADVWNIGDKDFLDKILVNLYNSDLGIDQNFTYSGDLNSGDTIKASFTFNTPSEKDEQIYSLEMKTYYDYDLDKDKYKKVSDETFVLPLDLSGNCIKPKASISASLESGGEAGQPLVVRARVTNTGTISSTYSFNIKGFSEWASSADVNFTQTSGSLLTLGAGESEDILITLDVNEDTPSGNYTFNIEAISDSNIISSQPVQVAVSAKPKIDKTTLAILLGLAAIIIIIVIVLIVRASRKK